MVDARQCRHLVRKSGRGLGVGQPLHEVGQEIAPCITLNVGHVGVRDRALLFARDCCHGRQRSQILQHARAGVLAVVHQRRNKDKALHADALLRLQILHDLRSANSAVTLPHNEFRRRQAVRLLQPTADRHRDRGDVAIDRVKSLAHVVARGDEAAVSGTDRIDENEIGKIKPRLGVGLQFG